MPIAAWPKEHVPPQVQANDRKSPGREFSSHLSSMSDPHLHRNADLSERRKGCLGGRSSAGCYMSAVDLLTSHTIL